MTMKTENVKQVYGKFTVLKPLGRSVHGHACYQVSIAGVKYRLTVKHYQEQIITHWNNRRVCAEAGIYYNKKTIFNLNIYSGCADVEQYIVDSIDIDVETDEDKIRFLFENFNHKHTDNYQMRKALEEYLKGLPDYINLPSYDSEKIRMAINFGALPENATEKEKEKILNNYWPFMAKRIMVLFKKYDLNKGERK